jgi:DNA-binding response OmpR family regulator/signal transduction histidine kinase/ligand-binding sensor domain-containing protein
MLVLLILLLAIQGEKGVYRDPLESFRQQKWIAKQFTFRSGLNVNALSHVKQDRHGFIWISSYDGLQRFDGVRFTNFDTRNNQQIPSNRFLYTVESAAGIVYAITEREQMVQIRFDSVSQVLSGFPDAAQSVLSIWGDGLDTQLVATRKGGFLLDRSGNPKKFTDSPLRQVFRDGWRRVIMVDMEGGVSVLMPDGKRLIVEGNADVLNSQVPSVSKGGEQWISAGRILFHSTASAIDYIPLPITPAVLSFTGDGKLLIGRQRAGWYLFSQDKNINPFESGPGKTAVADFLAPSGRRISASTKSVFVNGLPIWNTENTVASVIEDKEKNIWVATESDGLFRLFQNKMKYIGKEEGIGEPNVYSLAESSDGTIWLPTFEGGVYTLKRNTLEKLNVTFPSHQGSAVISTVEVLRNGTVLFGTMWNGFYALHHGKISWNHFGYEKPEVQSFFELTDGKIWIGTSNGLYELSNTLDISAARKISGAPGALIRIIRRLSDGSIVLGGNRPGLWRFQDGKFENISSVKLNGAVREIFEDTTATRAAGVPVIWIGTEAKGMLRVVLDGKENPVQRTGAMQGLIDDTIHRIFLDAKGRLWIGTNKGVMVVGRSELERCATGEIARIDPVVLNEESGMRNREVNSGNNSAGIVDNLGRFWFPTQAGFAIFDPTLDWDPALRTTITITGLRSGQSYHLPSTSVQLDQNESDFSISWAVPAFSDHGLLKYRFRLSGYEDKWRETGGQSTFQFLNIPGGRYVFELQYARPFGGWQDTTARLLIEKRKHFSETPLVYLAFLVLLAAVISFIVWAARLRSSLSKARLEQIIDARTAELMRERSLTEKQTNRLRKLDAARIAFLSSMSHEMRTPLTLVVGPVKLLLEDDSLPPGIQSQLSLIDRNADQLTGLLDNLLDITRYETGHLELEPLPLGISSLLNGAMKKFKPVMQARNVQLEMELTGSDPVILGDARRLSYVLDHVLHLMYRFAESDSTITLGTSVKNGRAEVVIRSLASLLPPDAADQVFEIFFQILEPGTSKVLDSGVGLAFSRQVLELHNGSISLVMKPERSVEIVISLPLEDVVSVVLNQEYSINDEEEPAELPEPGRKRLLVVDDNDQIRKFVKLIFAESYQVVEAENGKRALELTRTVQPDLIVADVMMPELDGVSMVKLIRADVMLAGIPVIMLTAKDTIQDTVEGLEAGADVYLTKPFNAEVLKKQVAALINSRERLKAKPAKPETAGVKSTPPARVDAALRTVPEASPPQLVEEHDTQFLAGVMDIIAVRYADPEFGVEVLANALYMDRSRLFRKLKQSGVQSAVKLIVEFRLNKALSLMRAKAGTITEVAYATGFNSLSHFGQTFKNHFGKTPKEWIDEHL